MPERLFVRFGFAWSDGRGACDPMELFLPAPHGLGTTLGPGRVQAQHDGQAVRPGREQRDRQTRAVARLPAAGERALPARLARDRARGPVIPLPALQPLVPRLPAVRLWIGYNVLDSPMRDE